MANQAADDGRYLVSGFALISAHLIPRFLSMAAATWLGHLASGDLTFAALLVSLRLLALVLIASLSVMVS